MTGSNHRQATFIILIVLILGTLFLIIPSSKASSALQANPAGTATPTVTPTATLGANPISQVTLYAFVDSPAGNVAQPYIILTAFANLPSGVLIQIRGVINEGLEFICAGTPCKLLLTTDSVIRYWAFTDVGNKSQENSVTVRIQKPSAGQYQVTLAYDNPISHYRDSCASIWNVYSAQYPAWAQMPQTPGQLNTGQPLYYLAGSLISSGIVDASSCPAGGLTGQNSPNACGMEKAGQAMIEWQNKFDLDIWLTSGAVGLPPKILKTLIMRESQFWPGNTRYFINEYGLAQINDYGADVVLRWDPTMYQQTCTGLLSDCSRPYLRISPSAQAMMRGALLSQLNSDCPGCKYGLNVEIAHTSIYVIARVLHANCWETHYILDQNKADLRNYEDLWKLTLVSYHSGYYCLNYAVQAAAHDGKTIDWASVSDHLACQGAKQYVDDFWAALTGFDKLVLIPSGFMSANIDVIPTPTQGPPQPTLAVSRVRVRVKVYSDINNDGTPQPSEGVNGVSVKLTFTNNESLVGTTDSQGVATFDLTGRTAGEVVVVTLPNLFRRENIVLPESGVVDVVFKFNQPQLPTSKP